MALRRPRWRLRAPRRAALPPQPEPAGHQRELGKPAPGRHPRAVPRRRVEALPPPEAPEAGPRLVPAIVSDETIDEAARERAREKVSHLTRYAPRPVLHARVTLRRHHDPACDRPVLASGALDVSGRIVRAHVSAAQEAEAVDLLVDRLRVNLDRLSGVRRSRRHESGGGTPGEWRHGDRPAVRPGHFVRPPGERRLLRRKTYAGAPRSPAEAALELQLLDYDFYLFTREESGRESVLTRDADGRLTLVDEAPVLTVSDAQTRLDAGGEPFVFFLEQESGRGHVLYTRLDGHYGLLEPE